MVCLPQILLGPFLNTLTHFLLEKVIKDKYVFCEYLSVTALLRRKFIFIFQVHSSSKFERPNSCNKIENVSAR